MESGFGKDFSLAAAIKDPVLRARLIALEANGNDSINSPFSNPHDTGVNGTGASNEEEAANFAAMQFLAQIEQETQERLEAINKRINELERRSYEALMRTEEELRQAQEELQHIQDNAYRITMPDGSEQRVYRDGDVVRTEDGNTVDKSVIRPEDIPDSFSGWQSFVDRNRRVDNLERKRDRIVDFREQLDDIRDRASTAQTPDDLDSLESLVDGLPEAVLDADTAQAQQPTDDFNLAVDNIPDNISPDHPHTTSPLDLTR